jgi:hypothetical protein
MKNHQNDIFLHIKNNNKIKLKVINNQVDDEKFLIQNFIFWNLCIIISEDNFFCKWKQIAENIVQIYYFSKFKETAAPTGLFSQEMIRGKAALHMDYFFPCYIYILKYALCPGSQWLNKLGQWPIYNTLFWPITFAFLPW